MGGNCGEWLGNVPGDGALDRGIDRGFLCRMNGPVGCSEGVVFPDVVQILLPVACTGCLQRVELMS